MFKFLQAPFEGESKTAVEKYTLCAHCAIVWESSKGVRLITASSARTPERQFYRNLKMQEWFQKLNSGPLREVKITLRVIFTENRKKPSPRPFFRADFGRIDFSEPGHGGSGVDGYW